MRKNKFRFLVLTLMFCACAIFVSGKENESKATRQLSIKKVPCQQNANLLFQPTRTAQFNYDLTETKSGAGFPLLGFAMPPPMFAFQLQEVDLTGTGTGPKYSWVCVAVCVAWCGENSACLGGCMANCIMN